MLPSVFVFGSRYPRCQLNVIKAPQPSPRVSLILTIFRSRYIRNGYWLVFCKPWERIREEGERVTVIHGRLAALILKQLNIVARCALGHDDAILQTRYGVRRRHRKSVDTA